ncbi:MAG: hypothetical protein QOE62_3078 [Actinomycetota bacterium]|nr:hypothetical protein [Actinomycetota bacterium]
MGLPDFATPACFVSTHLDDAVMSCGHLIAQTADVTIMTIFAGAPDANFGGWNCATTGQHNARGALGVRRAEDIAAAKVLNSTAVHLDLWESEFFGPQNISSVVALLGATIEAIEPASVFLPVGLHHSDHIAVNVAGMELVNLGLPAVDWFAYLDVPYNLAFQHEVEPAVARVAASARIEELEPVEPVGHRRRHLRRHVSEGPTAHARRTHPARRSARRGRVPTATRTTLARRTARVRESARRRRRLLANWSQGRVAGTVIRWLPPRR